MDNDSLPLYPQTRPHNKVVPGDVMNTPTPTVIQPRPTSPAPGPPAYTAPPPLLLGPDNTITSCPFCNASIRTSVKYTTTTQTHIAATHCALFCCCCCLPYCMDSAKNVDHYCANCKRYLGTYRR